MRQLLSGRIRDMPVATCHSVVQHFSLPLDESQVEAWATEQREVLVGPVTFGLLFCAPDAAVHAAEILEIVRIYAQTSVVVGCSAGGLIAGSRELEGDEGFSLALYHLPGTRARSVYLEESLLLGGDAADLAGVIGPLGSSVNGWLLLAASGSLSNDGWLSEWDKATSSGPTFGGFTGNPSTGATALFCDAAVYGEGAVALALEGDVTIEPLLSQGCRPVGSPWTITRAEQNIIHQIGNRPILEVLRDTLQELSVDEQQQARGNIFIGLVMDEYKASFGTGDFLVRNLAAI
ncbi:MAG TPA: FIST N-terminal domain-containing protein, partial [Opitutales bacterium]|nr:FIST N-terminal domain-containing protein [Opitutales bacterium]